jgi:hypothetical protein
LVSEYAIIHGRLALEDDERQKMAENKTKPTELSVVAFIDTITEPTRRADA